MDHGNEPVYQVILYQDLSGPLPIKKKGPHEGSSVRPWKYWVTAKVPFWSQTKAFQPSCDSSSGKQPWRLVR